MKTFTHFKEATLFAQKNPEELLIWIEGDILPLDYEYFVSAFKEDVSVAMTLAPVCEGQYDLLDSGEIVEKEFSLIDGYKKYTVYALRGKDFLALSDGEAFFLNRNPKLKIRGVPTYQKPAGEKRPALFLDRDGVVNVDTGYLRDPKHLVFHEDFFPLLRFANENQFYVCVLTNQSGVAYGKFGVEAIDELHEAMVRELSLKGLKIDAFYACPFLRNPKSLSIFNFDSSRRKPHPGLMLDACADFPIDLQKSFMVGDKDSDILSLFGPEYLLVRRTYELSSTKGKVFSSLTEILEYIKAKVSSQG